MLLSKQHQTVGAQPTDRAPSPKMGQNNLTHKKRTRMYAEAVESLKRLDPLCSGAHREIRYHMQRIERAVEPCEGSAGVSGEFEFFYCPQTNSCSSLDTCVKKGHTTGYELGTEAATQTDSEKSLEAIMGELSVTERYEQKFAKRYTAEDVTHARYKDPPPPYTSRQSPKCPMCGRRVSVHYGSLHGMIHWECLPCGHEYTTVDEKPVQVNMVEVTFDVFARFDDGGIQVLNEAADEVEEPAEALRPIGANEATEGHIEPVVTISTGNIISPPVEFRDAPTYPIEPQPLYVPTTNITSGLTLPEPVGRAPLAIHDVDVDESATNTEPQGPNPAPLTTLLVEETVTMPNGASYAVVVDKLVSGVRHERHPNNNNMARKATGKAGTGLPRSWSAKGCPLPRTTPPRWLATSEQFARPLTHSEKLVAREGRIERHPHPIWDDLLSNVRTKMIGAVMGPAFDSSAANFCERYIKDHNTKREKEAAAALADDLPATVIEDIMSDMVKERDKHQLIIKVITHASFATEDEQMLRQTRHGTQYFRERIKQSKMHSKGIVGYTMDWLGRRVGIRLDDNKA